MNDNDRIVTANSSKYILGVALGILAEPTASDEERDAMVYFFQRWNPSKFLTREDAAELRRAILAAPEYCRVASRVDGQSGCHDQPAHQLTSIPDFLGMVSFTASPQNSLPGFPALGSIWEFPMMSRYGWLVRRTPLPPSPRSAAPSATPKARSEE